MAELQSTNVTGNLCVNGIAIGGGGKDYKFCCFTASDSWTPPSDLVTGDGVADIVAIGGGGGGGHAATATNCSAQRGIAAGAGAGGGVGTGQIIMTSSNDACTVTVGAGGTRGEVEIGFGYFSDCGCITPGTKGGDSSLAGVIGYGGGAGAIVHCSDGRYSICCDVNSFGGPMGGTTKVRKCCNQYTTYAQIAQDKGNSQGGTCVGGFIAGQAMGNGQAANSCRANQFNVGGGCEFLRCQQSPQIDTGPSHWEISQAQQNLSGSKIGSNNPLEVDVSCGHQHYGSGVYGYFDGRQYMGVGGAGRSTGVQIPGQAWCGVDDTCLFDPVGFGMGGGTSPTQFDNTNACKTGSLGTNGTDGIVILKWYE